jgi:gas vesicle protein
MANRDGNGFLWFLAGVGLGAVVGVLYAPLTGSETRRAIREKAEEGTEFVRNRAREAREQAQQWADRGRETFKQQKDQFRSAYEAGRQAYHEATGPESSAGESKNV